MNGKVKSAAWITLILISIATIGIALHYKPAIVKASPDWIAVSPPSYEGSTVGEEFTVKINVSVTGLVGFEYKFIWNNTLLDVIQITITPPWGGYFIGANATTDLGDGRTQHLLGVASLPVTVWTGDATICTYTFRVAYKPSPSESVGYSLLDLQDTKFSDISANPIAHDTYDGEYTIKAVVHDVAVTDVVTNTTEVYIPEIVGIDVTVKNNGDTAETFNVTAYYDSTKIDIPQTVTDLTPGENTTLTFNWDTMFITPGNYTIKAVADTVLGETHTEDNTLTNGWVVVKLRHISITNVVCSTDIKYLGGIVRIEVTVANTGTENETFPLTVYLNTTALETKSVTVISHATKSFVFVWNTTGCTLGNYTVKAEASVLPHETRPDDNTLTDGIVSLITLPENIPYLEVDPPIVYVTPANGTLTVNVWIKDLNESWNMAGWEFRLWYNTTILDIISIEEGPFLKGFGTTYFVSKYGEEGFDYVPRDSTFEKEGCILAGCTLISGSTPHGEGILATITFNATGTGTSALALYLPWSPYCAKLSDAEQHYIPVISEFPAAMIMLILLTGTLIATILAKKQSERPKLHLTVK